MRKWFCGPFCKPKEERPPKQAKELAVVHRRLDRVEQRVDYIEKSVQVFKARGD